ncbi:MAG: GFA family protein [Oscillatoriales cyanobacterium]|nr:MAG: GFA family protein [Oscillatoriales cyanobacterium]
MSESINSESINSEFINAGESIVQDWIVHTGGCHCGRVRFRVLATPVLIVQSCNCSMCDQTGFLHLLVSRSCFQLLSGEDNLTTYTFNTGTAKHLFCKTCGIKSFYIPRSHPDGYSVNARCLDPETIERLEIEPFDGRNWETNIDALRAATAKASDGTT